jgi:hypothetical protein
MRDPAWHQDDVDRPLAADPIRDADDRLGRSVRYVVGEMRSKAAGLFYVCDGMVMRLVRCWGRDCARADLGPAPDAG